MERWQAQTIIRLVMCMGRHCNAGGRADPLYEQMRQTLGEPADFRCRTMVRWERANCLSHCDYGPNFVFYPQGTWFHQVDVEQLATIIAQYRTAQQAMGEGQDDNSITKA